MYNRYFSYILFITFYIKICNWKLVFLKYLTKKFNGLKRKVLKGWTKILFLLFSFALYCMAYFLFRVDEVECRWDEETFELTWGVSLRAVAFPLLLPLLVDWIPPWEEAEFLGWFTEGLFKTTTGVVKTSGLRECCITPGPPKTGSQHS